MIVVTSTFRAKPGMRDKIIELAPPVLEATRKEEGCIRYELLMSVEDDVTLQFVEEWADIEKLRVHLKTPHLAAFKKARESFVATEGAILKIFEAQEVKLN